MGSPTDPPRNGIRAAVRDLIAACSWTNGQLVNASDVAVKASLTQISTSGFGMNVEWLASVAADYGSAVTVIIPQATYDIIKNGAHDAATGLVAHSGKTYTFQHIMSGTTRSMIAVEV